MESDSNSRHNSRQLLDFPDEILISIYGFLDLSTILQALPVCRRLYGLAEPFLYHTIKVLNRQQGFALSTSFAAQPRRATWVRSFLVSTKLGDDDGLAGLPPFIAQMANLQDLRLETPDCNKKDPAERVGWVSLQDRYERVFEAASALIPRGTARLLPSLKTCTIHFVDEDKAIYSMTRYSMLFLHPSLKSLTISCASTDLPEALWTSFEGDPLLVKSTGLEHLHLEECDMHPATLCILLSFPRELKSLKISEAIRYDRTFSEQSSRMHGDVCPASFTDAIAEHCAESLEFLSLSLGHFRRRGQNINQYGQNLNLLRFEHLKHLELDLLSVNLVRTRPICDHATWRRLPPSLETLKVFSIPLGQSTPFRALGKAYFPFDVCLVREKAKHGVPNLRRMICSYQYVRQDDQPTLIISDDEQTVEAVSEVSLAKERLIKDCSLLRPVYRKAGVQLEIEMVILPTGFIPPYLYPENQPTKSTLWMS